jgi:trigger factor
MTTETNDLTIAVEKPSAWGRELTITVSAAAVDRERAATVSRIAKKAKIPGFRKGKIPPGVIQKRFGAAVEQEMLERLIGDAYREAVKREKLKPITQANVDRVDYKAGSDLTFHVAMEVRPDVELNRIGGFRLKREVPVVSEPQVTSVLDRLRDQQASWHPLEGEALADGDMVVVEITPLAEGVAGKPRMYRLVLGEGQAAPAIEAVIRTLQPGQEGDFTVMLPENADDASSPEKEHQIRVRVPEAKRPVRPELDDAFAKSLGEFGSLAELQERVRSDLQAEAGREADRLVRSRLIQQIVEANPFDVPSSMVDEYLARLVPQREGEDAGRVEEVRRQAFPAAVDGIRRMLVIEKIAETEALGASPDEVTAKVNEIAQKAGRSPGDVRARFEKSGRLEEIEHEITEDKVFQYLSTLSTIE